MFVIHFKILLGVLKHGVLYTKYENRVLPGKIARGVFRGSQTLVMQLFSEYFKAINYSRKSFITDFCQGSKYASCLTIISKYSIVSIKSS